MSHHPLNLELLRSQQQGREQKTPFPHQINACHKLDQTFTFTEGNGKGGLLVLPTGAGKTFTAVKWICDEVIRRNIKVLWLAHSYYLLDQAFKEFYDYAHNIPAPRRKLDIRLVSGNPLHDRASSIRLTDDVVIMTTQTAIKNLHFTGENNYGAKATSRFREYVDSGNSQGLFVVLDEAHHAPAHGCRSLLISKDKIASGIRTLVPGTNLLGLTATPTYTDEKRRGWLKEIFEKGVISDAEKTHLTQQGILARPKYIEKPTGRELVVSEELYNRIVRDHKDLPEDIINVLARDSKRNDYIVQEYIKDKGLYGKTIIFADRWHQCVYLKKKLCEKGVSADAIYSHIDADPGNAEARNKRPPSENQRILNKFKRNELDVLVNVRMLTEGADVPSVRTVFLTRQTTSAILMTQMIGRALRGPRAGGGDEANIVLFMDDWKRLIDWTTPASLDGGTETRQAVHKNYPLEYISIRLIEELSRQINSSGELPSPPFNQIVPVGWFETEFDTTSSETGSDETESIVQFVMVYEHTKPNFDRFVEHYEKSPVAGWNQYVLPPGWDDQAAEWASHFFGRADDHIGASLEDDLVRIARHISQWQSAPKFFSFDERRQYDLYSIARKG